VPPHDHGYVDPRERARVEVDSHERLRDEARRSGIGLRAQAIVVRNRGALVLVRDLEQACEIANRIAPEHLEISTAAARHWMGRIRHAGAIFLGPYASESLGDYCAGPNHVLPTSRTARFSSPLGVADFQKRSSVIEISEAGAKTLGATASRLARGEGLDAHARSAAMRMAAAPRPGSGGRP
jgi:histidinol dehydrogenase